MQSTLSASEVKLKENREQFDSTCREKDGIVRSLQKQVRERSYILARVPRLSPCANEKSKERGEPGRIYHVTNVIGRENLITCGRTNDLATLYEQNTVVIALWPTEWD